MTGARRRMVYAGGFAVAVAVGGVLGWWSARETRAWLAEAWRMAGAVDSRMCVWCGDFVFARYIDLADFWRSFDAGEKLSRDQLWWWRWLLRVGGDLDASFRVLRRSVEEYGTPDDICSLAFAYLRGRGTDPDPDAAYELFRRLHGLKHPWGAYGLAHAHRDGLGVPRDVPRAVELYEQAVRQGDVGDAAYELGEVYEHGLLGRVDVPKAVEWYRRALTSKDLQSFAREAAAALRRLEGRHMPAASAGR